MECPNLNLSSGQGVRFKAFEGQQSPGPHPEGFNPICAPIADRSLWVHRTDWHA